MEKIVIIGSGPAGLTAAIYSGRANLQPLVVEGFQTGGQSGGQLMTTTEVENYPGFEQSIMGPELISKMRTQAERFGTRFVSGDILGVDFSTQPFKLNRSSGDLEARCVLIATGARANILDHPSVKKYWGKGVSACATCDGALPVFRNKPIMVIGGGDSAIEEALFLTKFASKVIILHRRDAFRASKIMQKRAFENSKIEIIFDSVIEDLFGEKFVQGAKIKNIKTAELKDVQCSGIFMGIGHTPNTSFLNGALQLDEKGYIVTKPFSTATSIKGVFACGDVSDPQYRQAITAAGSGCAASIEAERYLSELGE
ncbi:MAG: thioredoxin-disulfide reductase [Candidatus Riflebacteria bacterium]|nr:thioredoxin-disulfide reductase [Candidatus Riflebacteria bacterium]